MFHSISTCIKLSMLDYRHCDFVGRIARKFLMNLFVAARKRVLRRKLAIGMTVLVAMGVVGGGNIVAQSHSNGQAGMANCPSHATTSSSCATAHPTGTRHGTTSVSTEQSGHPQSQPKKTIRPRPQVADPAPISALRVYPTPVPTNPPVATPQPTSPPPGPTGPGQSSVAAMIEQVFGSYAAGALQVARCESGLNPNAYNPTSIGGSHAEGVFQILYPSTWMGTSEAGSSPYNARANILAAHEIFVRDGYSWREWSCAS